MPRFSLILATVGRTAELDRLFDSLAAQNCQDFEVILIDQNVDDRLLTHIDRARLLGLNVHTRQLSPPNLAAARNLGIALAQGDWIGFPDDDCWYEPDALSNLLAASQQDAGLEGLIACWVEQAAANATTTSSNGHLKLEDWRNFRGGDASSITLFFRRSLIERLGKFDARLGVGQWFGAGEETDYVLRALAAGARLVRYPNARVHHPFVVVRAENWRVVCGNARCRSRGTGALYAKHRLSPYVIIRGWIAPIVFPLLRMQGFQPLLLGIAVVIGRIEGFVRWGWGRL